SAQLVQLQLQAQALASLTQQEDALARYQRFRQQGDAALAEKNLRAAALAYDAALAARPDPALEKQLASLRADLDKYDGLRKRAAELRREPSELDEALDALKEASKIWDNLQIRQEMDECALALQKRRDTVSVADFEVHGDVGFADAGTI